jgi:hypothetical protein
MRFPPPGGERPPRSGRSWKPEMHLAHYLGLLHRSEEELREAMLEAAPQALVVAE